MPQDLGAHPAADATPGPKTVLGRPTRGAQVRTKGAAREPASEQSEQRERASDPAPLPRPPRSNNCTETVAFPAAAARTAHALQVNVQAAVKAWGIESTGFLTLTFADHITDPKVAQKRMHSLATHVLKPRYGGAIRVMERQGSGRIHYHLLVNVGADIRTGFDFSAIKKQDYRSASPALRTEWAFWRRTAKLYGFGRTELLPVISTAEAVGRYVGKYISKHLSVRGERHLGVSLVSYSGPRVATVKFAWADGRARDWRAGLGSLVRDLAATGRIDFASVDAMRRQFGKRWAWDWRDAIVQRGWESRVDKSTGEICASKQSVDSMGTTGVVRREVEDSARSEAHQATEKLPGAAHRERAASEGQRPIRNTYRPVREIIDELASESASLERRSLVPSRQPQRT